MFITGQTLVEMYDSFLFSILFFHTNSRMLENPFYVWVCTGLYQEQDTTPQFPESRDQNRKSYGANLPSTFRSVLRWAIQYAAAERRD